MEPDDPPGVQRPVRRVNWTIVLVGGLLLVVLVIIYFATRGNVDQDKLTTANVTQTAESSGEKACASKATYDLIKRDLFRRAAQLRGSDQAAFDRLAGYAVLRMENPVMASEDSTTRAVHCAGSLSLDLPPGVAVVGGRRTLASDVDYTVQQAADGSREVVLLQNADSIVTPLATLVRVAQPTAEPSASEEQNGVALQPPAPAPTQPSAVSPSPAPPPSAPRPSFSCANAKSRGETIVCGDAGLAALDRNMAVEYGRAAATATPEQRDLLVQTAHRFYAYRDYCPDRQCIAAAYAGRIREIRDIVLGRWQPPR